MGKRKSAGIQREVDTPVPVSDDDLPPEFKKFDKPFGLEQHQLFWMILGISHVCTFYYIFYLFPFGYVNRWTAIPGIIYGYLTGLGTTMGSHRLWTHKTYKANLPLQILLMLLQTGGLQYPIFKWCRDHRVHHKYTDTNADPHSAARGFWFSHIGWLLQPKHPDVDKALKIIDISDLAKDPVIRFQSKYYWQLLILTWQVLPMYMFHILFPELSLFHLFVVNMARYTISLNFTFLVNSIAHMYGDKPYDKYITPTENTLVAILAAGEGWHNYHHTFPWDYRTAEIFKINFSTVVINFFAKIGWCWDLKTVNHKMLVDRINRTGDGTHFLHDHSKNNNNNGKVEKDFAVSGVWGWGDKSLTNEDIEVTETLAKRPRG